MLQNLQILAPPKNQLDNLVDFEKCCKTRICLQRSVPIQLKTSDFLPKICQKLGRAGAARTWAQDGPLRLRPAGHRDVGRLVERFDIEPQSLIFQPNEQTL